MAISNSGSAAFTNIVDPLSAWWLPQQVDPNQTPHGVETLSAHVALS